MPTQKQSLDYFAGEWTFKWLGAESPLGPGPRTGTVVFSPIAGSRFLESRTDGKSDEGAYTETGILGFHEERQVLASVERRANGVEIVALGDWSVPITIRFDVAPIRVRGQTIVLKRTVSVISAGSFSVVEEFSVDGSPFQRLGNGLYHKKTAAGTPPRPVSRAPPSGATIARVPPSVQARVRKGIRP